MTPYPQPDAWPGGEQPPGPGDPAPQEPAEDAVDAEVVEDLPGADASPEDAASAQPQDEAREDSVVEEDVVEGEIVDPATSDEALADALLAEALDEDAIEAQFTAAEAEAQSAAGGASAAQVAALTTDLQRVHAEYSNYRKRVERDRALMRDKAVEETLLGFLPILDDIDRAREHGDLVGGFKAVAEALEALIARKGMVRFGVPGELFDPTRHEALMREERDGITEPTVVTVLQVGYEMNGRIVRPARVSVAGIQ